MYSETIHALASAIAAPILAALKPLLDAAPPDAGAGEDAGCVQMEEASSGGDNTSVPGPIKKKSEEDDEEGLRVRYQNLREEREEMAVQVTRLRCARRCDELEKEGGVFDRGREMAKDLRRPPELRDGHFAEMREYYHRTAAGARA